MPRANAIEMVVRGLLRVVAIDLGVEEKPKRSHKDIRIEYLQSIAADSDEDGDDDVDDE